MPIGVYKHYKHQGFQERNNYGALGKNKIVSSDTKKKLSVALRGKSAWNKGLTKYSDERVMRNSKSIKKTWHKSSHKRSVSMRETWKLRKEQGLPKDLLDKMSIGGINSIKKQASAKSSRPQKRMAKLLMVHKDPKAFEEYHININGKHMLLDVAFPEEKVAFEFHGKYWHDKTKEKDAKRHELLLKNGWQHYVYNEDSLHELNLADKEVNKFLESIAADNFRVMFACQ